MIVIGGGDTGTDCVGTSHAARLPQPGAVRDPAACRRWSGPRTTPGRSGPRSTSSTTARKRPPPSSATTRAQYLIQTKKFVGDDDGHVKEIAHRPQSSGSKDNGRVDARRKSPAREQVFPAQLVLLAMGFLGPENQLLDQLGVEKDPRTNAKAEHGKFATSVPGVFAAGDMRRGQSLVVWAINEGRGAARECDRFLMGETALP